jgi:hypothetical protein
LTVNPLIWTETMRRRFARWYQETVRFGLDAATIISHLREHYRRWKEWKSETDRNSANALIAVLILVKGRCPLRYQEP